MFAENGMNMEKDEIFETAERYVKSTGRSVFLTGKAGTGKTTFLKYITSTTAKRFVVLAPTGVAAINAGGSTIHSFFQLPLCPYLPDVKDLVTEYQMPEKYRSLRKERVRIIRTLDLLIIDEISMVRADLLDAVDMTLRKYRRNDRPFGGVQLLMIGDAQQLSPVVKDVERQYMSQVYPSPYFFHSKALQKLPYLTIELQKVHRQRDADFLEILNAVREDKLDSRLLDKINSRVGAVPVLEDGTDPIRLTTHNVLADEVNNRKLAELPGEVSSYIAEIEGDFPEHSYPADEVLALKPGAQVMFIRNDTEGRYYNGKLAKIEKIAKGFVTVSDSDGVMTDVIPVEWNNSQYELDDDSGEICQKVLGTFRQIPLRIAWAITIHKSQGLTFDNVIIDAGAAFAFGQVYVALSRCRSLEGISLESPIRSSGIYRDMHVSAFNAEIPSVESLTMVIDTEEKNYAYDQYRSVFDLDAVCSSFRYLLKLWRGVLEDTYPAAYERLETANRSLRDAAKVADTFRNQLTSIERSTTSDESFLKERLLKASGYFMPIIRDVRESCMDSFGLEIDNRETKKKVKDVMEEILTSVDIVMRSLELFEEGKFDTERLCRIRTECNLQEHAPAKGRKLRKIASSADGHGVVNEELKDRLQQWRSDRFKADNVPAFTIMHQSTLMQIATLIPVTRQELLSIKGFGEARFRKYGEEIISICSEFRKDL